MQKAKSRLKQNNFDTPSKIELELPREFVNSRNSEKRDNLVKYLQHLPALILSFLFYLIIFFIFKNFSPELFKNIILENSYLPVLILLFLANFFLFSFIFLNSIKGFVYSFYLLLIVFFKIQDVIFNFPLILILVVSLIVFEIIFKVFSRIRKNS